MTTPSRDWNTILAEHRAVVQALHDQGPALDAIVDTLNNALQNGRRVFIFGNGGSAADAQHIAAELLGRFRRDRAALPALALTTDTSTITAIANDLAFEQIFARQLAGLLQPGDVAWGLSTSGRSRNVLAAIDVANAHGGITIGFTGHPGEPLAQRCRQVLRVPHDAADRIQEAHQLAYHYICEQVEAACS